MNRRDVENQAFAFGVCNSRGGPLDQFDAAFRRHVPRDRVIRGKAPEIEGHDRLQVAVAVAAVAADPVDVASLRRVGIHTEALQVQGVAIGETGNEGIQRAQKPGRAHYFDDGRERRRKRSGETEGKVWRCAWEVHSRVESETYCDRFFKRGRGP